MHGDDGGESEKQKTQPPVWTDNWRFPAAPTRNKGLLFLASTSASFPSNSLIAASASPADDDELDDGSTMEPPTVATVSPLAPVSASPVYALVISVVTVLLIVTSILTIVAIRSSRNKSNRVLGCYFISLSISDLLCGALITPLSIYAAFANEWPFGEVWCKIEAYLEVVMWITCAYGFIWIGVDRHAAINKPSRYESDQTMTRCRCWIIFTWVSATLLCLPTLFHEMKTSYSSETKVCMMEWYSMKAYSITLIVLVVSPSVVCVICTYSFIFKKFANIDEEEQEVRAIIENDQTFMMSFFVILVFAISWLPWFLLRAYEVASASDVDNPVLHFTFLWLAIGSGSWKFFIYAIGNSDFRIGLNRMITSPCSCLWSERRRSQEEDEKFQISHSINYLGETSSYGTTTKQNSNNYL